MTHDMSLRKLLLEDYKQHCILDHKPLKRRTWPMYINPKLTPVALIRLACACHKNGLGLLGILFSQLNVLLFKVDAPRKLIAGPGLVLPHPMGIVLGSASIGKNVTIFQNVTLGARFFDANYDLDSRPTLGDKVTVGAGAAILGPITIGDNVIVSANSLVIRDVASGTTVMGVPSHLNT